MRRESSKQAASRAQSRWPITTGKIQRVAKCVLHRHLIVSNAEWTGECTNPWSSLTTFISAT